MRDDVKQLALFEPKFYKDGEAYYLVRCPFCEEERKPGWTKVATFDEISKHCNSHYDISRHNKRPFPIQIVKDKDGYIYRRSTGILSLIQKEQRIGASKMMECGMEATVIAYRNSGDIDVKFTNGRIRRHVPWLLFERGLITDKTKPQPKDYLGKTKIMNCGLECTITKYADAENIEVTFSNGETRQATYKRFKRGTILPPSRTRITKEKAVLSRLHEKRMMKCGMEAEIIEYKDSAHIKIRFEDGNIRNANYAAFLKGTVEPHNRRDKAFHIGETRQLDRGMTATIVEYNNSDDMLVKYSDGVLQRTTYSAFKAMKHGRRNMYTAKPCRNTDTGKTYISIRAAAKDTGISTTSISNCCKHNEYTAGGYHWQYADTTKKI